MKTLTAELEARLLTERNIWLATVRPSCRPHLIPIWFIWQNGRFHLGIQSKSVKAHNLRQNPRVSLSLENGSDVLICEGVAHVLPTPWPAPLLVSFQEKYAWDILNNTDGYDTIIAIQPNKWLFWGEEE
ncbi:MAG: pyridoxamine 5'-phosphate oxidase [Chloroflexi bacterium]|nr:pyridoxamine 5'-phosphate oxidase [Chloroflexota bacterium]